MALLAAAALAWALTVRFASGMPAGPGTMGLDLPAFLALWALMMAAMMLPSVAPFASLYARTLRARSTGRIRVLRSLSLLTGYLAAWVLFGLIGYVAAWAGGRLATQAPNLAAWIGAGVLAAAGLYQLTPLKSRCLSRCRSPLGFLLQFGGRSGRLRDLRVGLHHGAYCVGCCSGLMVVLVAVGTMNLAWMAALAGTVLLEKTWRHGKGFSIAFGLAMIAFACVVPWHPSLLPGLYMHGGM